MRDCGGRLSKASKEVFLFCKDEDIVYSLMKVKEVRKRTARSYESCE